MILVLGLLYTISPFIAVSAQTSESGGTTGGATTVPPGTVDPTEEERNGTLNNNTVAQNITIEG